MSVSVLIPWRRLSSHSLWKRRQPELFKKSIVLRRCFLDSRLDLNQFGMCCRYFDLNFTLSGADVAGNVQVEIVFLDLLHLHPAGIAFDRLLWTFPVGLDDLVHASQVVGGYVLFLAD